MKADEGIQEGNLVKGSPPDAPSGDANDHAAGGHPTAIFSGPGGGGGQMRGIEGSEE